MIQEKTKQKVKILAFWDKHGLDATLDAYSVKKRTLYLWKQKLREGNGRLESLNERSKAPIKRRERITNKEVEEFIIKTREEHPRLGKEKMNVLLKEEGLMGASDSTVGRIIKDLKERGKIKKGNKISLYGKTGVLRDKKPQKKRKKLRIKDYKPKQQGDLIQIDTVVKFINGIRRYMVTAIDTKSDFAFAYTYKSPSSKNTKDFFQKLEDVSPFQIQRIQTDNGSEFEKYFREYIEKRKITHFHNYPRCPKMNAFVERFNRTIQEEFADFNLNTLAYDIDEFNDKLIKWLLWYNTKRPHHSLGLISPMKFIINSYYPKKCNMLWTSTLF